MVMKNYHSNPSQKRWRDSRWTWQRLKIASPKSRTIAEGGWLTEIITYALDNSPEKAVEFTTAPSNLTELMWPMTVDPFLRQNMISGILDTVAYNVARKNKDQAPLWDRKSLEQTGNKRRLPNEINSFAFALTGLVAEKDFQTPVFQLTPSTPRESWKSLHSLGSQVTYTATQEIKSSTQDVQPCFNLDQVDWGLGTSPPCNS